MPLKEAAALACGWERSFAVMPDCRNGSAPVEFSTQAMAAKNLPLLTSPFQKWYSNRSKRGL
jgi:hypothetical protein